MNETANEKDNCWLYYQARAIGPMTVGQTGLDREYSMPDGCLAVCTTDLPDDDIFAILAPSSSRGRMLRFQQKHKALFQKGHYDQPFADMVNNTFNEALAKRKALAAAKEKNEERDV